MAGDHRQAASPFFILFFVREQPCCPYGFLGGLELDCILFFERLWGRQFELEFCSSQCR